MIALSNCHFLCSLDSIALVLVLTQQIATTYRVVSLRCDRFVLDLKVRNMDACPLNHPELDSLKPAQDEYAGHRLVLLKQRNRHCNSVDQIADQLNHELVQVHGLVVRADSLDVPEFVQTHCQDQAHDVGWNEHKGPACEGKLLNRVLLEELLVSEDKSHDLRSD